MQLLGLTLAAAIGIEALVTRPRLESLRFLLRGESNLASMFFGYIDTRINLFQENYGFTENVAAHYEHVRLVNFRCIQKFAEAAVRPVNIAGVIDACYSHDFILLRLRAYAGADHLRVRPASHKPATAPASPQARRHR